MSEVRILEIRPKGGSQRDGFEELCVQLFRNDKGVDGDLHRINGAGGDGGVEAYHVDSNRRKTGMQAKFFHELGDSQWRQLDSSVKSMLKNHPDTGSYEVYVPLDRTPDKDAKWNERVEKWNRWAKESGLSAFPEYKWKGESEILDLLTRPTHRHFAHYWFGTPQFSLEWLAKINLATASDLERRYSPGQHVQTDSGRNVLAYAGLPEARTGLQEAFLKVHRARGKFEKTYHHSLREQPELTPALAEKTWTSVLDALSVSWPDERFPEIGRLLEKAKDAVRLFDSYNRAIGAKALEISKEGKSENGRYSHPLRSLENDASSLSTEMYRWIEFLRRHLFVDASKLLLEGEAGIGKSHLLADTVEKISENGQPALFLLGEHFTESQEPWTQLLSLIHWEGNLEQFLAAMSVQASQRGLPGLIIIDAINESSVRKLWKNHLRRFAAEIGAYANLKLIVSCRSDFRSITLPEEIDLRTETDWAEITHFGFGEELLEAIGKYFSAYSIKSSSFPPLLQEYRNPLFLRLFCEAFQFKELPRGAVTLEMVMETRLEALCKKIETDIDCPPEDTRAAVYAAARRLRQNGGRAVLKSEIKAAIDRHSPSKAKSQSLYHHLKSNGVLVELGASGEPLRKESEVRVRFPFERFSDYFIAREMVSGVGTLKLLKRALRRSSQFRWIFDYGEAYENRGVLSALVILVGERFQEELYFLIPRKWRGGALRLAFLDSIPWRGEGSFGRDKGRALSYAIKAFFWFDKRRGRLLSKSKGKRLLFEISDWNLEKFWEVLLRAGSILDHPFNADFLHHILRDMPVATRDELWTVSLTGIFAEESNSLPQQVLDWASRVPAGLVSDEQAELVATMLFWFLSSNYKKFRNDSTVAAIRLLKGRSHVVASLVKRFSEVNDPYVAERIYAVACGVAMQESDAIQLKNLAKTVFDSVFSKDAVTPHILLRDYAHSIMEMAQARGCLPEGATVDRFRPPYASKWPEIPDEEQLTELRSDEGWRKIFNSLAPEETGWYGDFGRYTMQYHVHQFSDRRIASGKEDPESADQFSAMEARRWSIKRIKELGWTPEKFANYERTLYGGRMGYDEEATKMERISKKYQWIALYELLGYLSDRNFVLNSYSDERLCEYRGLSDLVGRNFDPGSGIQEEYEAAPLAKSHPTQENYPFPFSDTALCADREAWVEETPADFAPLIELEASNRDSNHQWMVLQMFHHFRESPFDAYKVGGEGELSMWVHMRAWLVPSEVREDFLKEIRSLHFWGHGLQMVSIHNQRLGEYPWSDGFAAISEFCKQPDDWFRDLEIPHLQSVCTWGDGISTTVPSPQLIEFLDLKWSGENADFVNQEGELIVKGVPGKSTALVRKDALTKNLKEKGYEIVWGVLGERQCYDYEAHDFVVEKQREFSAVYWLEGGRITGGITHDVTKDFPKRGI